MNVTRYRAGDVRYLAVDAEHYVPDRAAFAARHCDPADGVAPPAGIEGDGEQGATDAVADDEQGGAAHTEQGGAAADGGPGHGEAGRPDGDPEPATGADGVLFLALEPAFRPPRVVMTVVIPDGERPLCCTAGVRCAARWVAERAGADRVMVDTQAGTREARVHDDGSVSVEREAAGRRCRSNGDDTERGPVVREFDAEVSPPAP